MKKFKVLITLCAILALSYPAWAGNLPEFDAVGQDIYWDGYSGNVFASHNPIQFGQAAFYNRNSYNEALNAYSSFKNMTHPLGGFFEEFTTYSAFSAGPPYAPNRNYDPTLVYDRCFNFLPFYIDNRMTAEQNDRIFFGHGQYDSVYVPRGANQRFTYRITLQMTPESDIDLNIYDCVLKSQGRSPWYSPFWAIYDAAADQTGRWRLPDGALVFNPMRNPQVTVNAYPGFSAAPGFDGEIPMSVRVQPGLQVVPANQLFYTSKGIWDENLVLKLPVQGEIVSGDTEIMTAYALQAGDVIEVIIDVSALTVDLYYGEDNVILKYIGLENTGVLGYMGDN
jgi:hypothetical protein